MNKYHQKKTVNKNSGPTVYCYHPQQNSSKPYLISACNPLIIKHGLLEDIPLTKLSISWGHIWEGSGRFLWIRILRISIVDCYIPLNHHEYPIKNKSPKKTKWKSMKFRWNPNEITIYIPVISQLNCNNLRLWEILSKSEPWRTPMAMVAAVPWPSVPWRPTSGTWREPLAWLDCWRRPYGTKDGASKLEHPPWMEGIGW